MTWIEKLLGYDLEDRNGLTSTKIKEIRSLCFCSARIVEILQLCPYFVLLLNEYKAVFYSLYNLQEGWYVAIWLPDHLVYTDSDIGLQIKNAMQSGNWQGLTIV